MKGRNIFIRIMALILCAVMLLGVVTAALYAFAAEPSVASPATGSANMTWVIIAVVAAVAVIVGCLAVPKIKKK